MKIIIRQHNNCTIPHTNKSFNQFSVTVPSTEELNILVTSIRAFLDSKENCPFLCTSNGGIYADFIIKLPFLDRNIRKDLVGFLPKDTVKKHTFSCPKNSH